jgi:hypothetical protein
VRGVRGLLYSEYANQVEKLQLGGFALAERRHAGYYFSVLDSVNRLYLKGDASAKWGLTLFDEQGPNIARGQAWAAARAPDDDAAAGLCSGRPGRDAARHRVF